MSPSSGLAGICFFAATLAMTTQAATPIAPTQSVDVAGRRTLASYGNLPVSFVANRGQSDERVKFLARGQG
jgi:hypothetical protein